jgi:hypothetical protein
LWKWTPQSTGKGKLETKKKKCRGKETPGPKEKGNHGSPDKETLESMKGETRVKEKESLEPNK